MQTRGVLGVLALLATASAQSYPLSLVYQFENSFSGVGYVNIENVAVRSSNGQLLLNFATGAIMTQLNPENPVPEILVNISNAYPGAPGSLTGIAETSPDVYTVAAGTFQFGPQVPGGIAGIPGSFSLWSVDLNGPKAKYRQIVAIPEAGLLNGVTALPGKGHYSDVVLVADSALGAIWRVNVHTGAYETIIQDPLLQPPPGAPFGVNGIHASGPYLYFTNSGLGFFGAIPISADGYPTGPVTPFVNAVNGTNFDDFALDANSNAWIATAPNAVYEVTRDSPVPILIAGGGDDMTLLGPTSAAFRGSTLFVVTGGAGGPMPMSGQVFRIETGGYGRKAKKWVA